MTKSFRKLPTVNFSQKVKVTNRENQVLQLICKGNTLNTIADTLFLSPYTIVSHKKNLIRKFKAKNIVHLGVLAERYGYVEQEIL